MDKSTFMHSDDILRGQENRNWGDFLFSNIIIYVSENSKMHISNIHYSRCTFIFINILRQKVFDVITAINADNCLFIMHDPSISDDEDYERIWDNKGVYYRRNCSINNVFEFIDNKDSIRNVLQNVSELRLNALLE